MADQTRVRPVFEHRRWPRFAPPGNHPPQVHVPPVECPLGRMLVVLPTIGIPELYRRVDIKYTPVVAPLYDFTTIDVPRQIDEEIPRRDVLAQQPAQVLRRHTLPDEGHALLNPGLQSRLVWLKVHDGDAFGIDSDVLQQNGQCAPRHGAKTNEQDAIRKCKHLLALPVMMTRAKPSATEKEGRKPERPKPLPDHSHGQ